MRPICRWLRDPIHVLGLALVGFLVPWVAVRVRRAKRGHRATRPHQRAVHGGHGGASHGLQAGRFGANGAAGPYGEPERMVEE